MAGVCLLIIDPQNDFCDKKGALCVDGASEDMYRLASFIKSNSSSFDNIIVTLDMHKHYHIASPIFWRNVDGGHPKFFSSVTSPDIQNGDWTTSNPLHRDKAFKYLTDLEESGRYLLTIWPPHCITGTWGADIFAPIAEAVLDFEKSSLGGVDYILKSSNSFTEHYSAVKAEIPMIEDRSTLTNKKLVTDIAKASKVIVAGEAASHCVANTVMDLAVALEGDLSKFIFLKDASSPVKNFEYLGELFIEKASEKGMKISDTSKAGRLL